MSISTNSREVADVRLERVELRPILGAYELLFHIQGKTTPPIGDQPACWFVLYGAQVDVAPVGGPKKMLGTARSDHFTRVQQSVHQSSVYAELKIMLQPHQVVAIEDFCHEQSLHFESAALGVSGLVAHDENRWTLEYTRFSKDVQRSEWIEQLRSAGVLDILSIEIPMPFVNVPPEWQGVAEHLRRAQRMYLEGHYLECVSRCRAIMDVLAKDSAGKQQWAEALKKLETQRDLMSKEEREITILAAVRNYTHLAAHPDDAIGTEHFTRGEAKLILTLSAAAIAHITRSGALFVH